MKKVLLALSLFFALTAAVWATTTYKVLGQSNPAATTATDVYTVPASTSTVISGIYVANRAGTNDTFRISIRVAGAAAANSQYIAYDMVVNANDTVVVPGGFTLGAGDVITVYAGTTNLSFNVLGAEIQ